MKLSGDFWGASDSLVGVASAEKIMFVKGASKASLVIKTGIAEEGGSSSDVFIVDLDE